MQFKTLFLAPSKLKLIDCTVHNPCLNFLENCDSIQFWSKMVQFSISQETLRADFAAKNRPIFAPKMSKEALLTGLIYSLKLISKKLFFYGTLGHWRLGYFSIMKYFGFIIFMRSLSSHESTLSFDKQYFMCGTLIKFQEGKHYCSQIEYKPPTP